MKARPTIYNGIQMRSRLEARVAAMLDEFGVTWEYEPVAFASGRSQYLPDFRLPDPFGSGVNVYIEVKPLVDDVAGALQRMSVIAKSEPTAFLAASCEMLLSHGVLVHYSDGEETPVTFLRCPCGAVTVGTAGPKADDRRTVFAFCWKCRDEAIRFTDSPRMMRLAEWNA
jgi:hypothetical protein